MYVKALCIEYINVLHAPARRCVRVHTYKLDTHIHANLYVHIYMHIQNS